MNHFSVREIKSHIEHYQKMANDAMEAFNHKEINFFALDVRYSDQIKRFYGFDWPPELDKSLREFLYDLVVHAVAERNKWQYLLENGGGADPIVKSCQP